MATLVDRVKQYGLLPDKRLGQHFLVAEAFVQRIVAAVPEGAGILEVGPGPATLTKALAESHAVTAVEADERWRTLLSDTVPEAKVVYSDALKTDLNSLLLELPEPRVIVSNMPYNITGPLLDVFMEQRSVVAKMVLMMQREVGDKILARPGNSARGALSVVMQRHYRISAQPHVPPGAFWPPPKVWSSVLEFTPRADVEQDDDFVRLVRSGFKSPRKTLANNLRANEIKIAIPESWSPSIRPHELAEEQWLTLSDQI
ncbi:MAG: ribosomal RNA small subunit methyltransferase A [Fimbriimonadaceae bacterium]|nr:ribosomal RNA small subunit methyltransferase A [Fimbriimonadaceae bacterium]